MPFPTFRARSPRLGIPLAVSCVAIGLSTMAAARSDRQVQPEIASRGSVPVLEIDGLRFRDMDRNGSLSPFEDWRLPPERRARDLVRRMTVPEKAGAMLHDALPVTGNAYDQAAARSLILDGRMSSFISRLAADGRTLAEQSNALQLLAEEARIAIPLTLSTDPRSHFQVTDGASVAAVSMSKWPETTGFAAIGDPALVERFATIARIEYRAAGLNMILAPQADLATEPRWPRVNGTFGEDPATVRAMVAAYVRGFQAGPHGLGPGGMPAVVKHWVGYGASDQGYDGHSYYGRFATLDRNSVQLHADAFRGAFAAGVSGVMPAYSILRVGNSGETRFPLVGAAFNRHVVTELLRGEYGFRGFVLSDWGITRDCGTLCRDGFPAGTTPTREGFSTAWGMEDSGAQARFARAANAGVDQFGGVSDSAPLIAAIEAGEIAPDQIDASVERIMALKFRSGLFENPYVDPDAAERIVGAAQFRAEGRRAQAMALTVLKRDSAIMPLPKGRKVWLMGVSAQSALDHGLVPVDRPEDADFGIVRLNAPWKGDHPQYYYGSRQHEGSLAFQSDDPALASVRTAANSIPIIASVYLDRPAILTPLVPLVAGLVVDFGASDDALLDGLAGEVLPQGRLPFELPSSEGAVEAQRGDLPHDSANPLFPIGFGLSIDITQDHEEPQKGPLMTTFTRRAIQTALASGLAISTVPAAHAEDGAQPVELAEHGAQPVPLAERGTFYVSGRDIERDGSIVRVQSMYVEYMVPAGDTTKLPIVLIHGNYQNGTAFLTTPDGRPGWAERFLKAGYPVYIVDQPMRGRSPYHPETDGPASVMTAAQLQRLFTAPEPGSSAPQTRLHTQWPGTGRPGDPVFDQFLASQQPTVQGPGDEVDSIVRSAVHELLLKIGPAIVLTHSRAGTFGWEAADDAPELVKAVVAIEPNGPPFFNPPGADGKEAEARARAWGVTYDTMTFDPPVTSPDEIAIEREPVAAGPDLLPCWLQKGKPRKLLHLSKIPALIVIGEASYHAPYDHCTARFLQQAGVPAELMRLEDHGLKGNGHMMMLERNSDAVADEIVDWLNSKLR